jgi:hypothetical protein
MGWISLSLVVWTHLKTLYQGSAGKWGLYEDEIHRPNAATGQLESIIKALEDCCGGDTIEQGGKTF